MEGARAQDDGSFLATPRVGACWQLRGSTGCGQRVAVSGHFDLRRAVVRPGEEMTGSKRGLDAGEIDRESGRPAVFVDRDGVINGLVPDPVSGLAESPLSEEAVSLLPGAAAALVELRELGWLIVCVTNQPAAAKGKVTEEQLLGVHSRVARLLEAEGARWDSSYLCLHHPDGVVRALSGECICRKPQPGMLLSAVAEHEISPARSWMVGDTDADIEAGKAVGARTVLVSTAGTAHKRRGGVVPDMVVDDLASAAAFIGLPTSGKRP